mmetsp:Transcript_92430/g.257486  ORF Transcript_92430/g.257486 Transcript_92430/m.257486 type:complete len:377 (-) Transcript_92430:140-1270(-)
MSASPREVNVVDPPDAGATPDKQGDKIQDQSIYRSNLAPPDHLWDTDDTQFLEKVKCHAIIRLTDINPKNGSFTARMKCSWRFRTLNSRDRTEVQLRVPGIRMPGLIVTVEESRIWRDLKESSDKTIYWRGTSLFSITGFEIFEVHQFPFDRQVINFELLDFVWRPHKDASTYDFSMRIVEFEVETVSLMPQWSTYSAILTPESETRLSRGPSNTSRFKVCLRAERKHWFYVIQVFLVTYLITSVSCFPLSMPPNENHIGDRLGLYGSGVLVLIAFKFAIADNLPSVPYSTFMDKYLLWQIVTIIALSVETLIAYRIVREDQNVESIVDLIENVMLGILLIVWLVYFLRATFFKKRQEWKYVVEHQDTNEELSDNE